ncbi:hypothetical protein GOBAR_AA40210 [Gossypium barbadense]|uniref:Thaumatin-like protein n=1 Tax=Gossypium barbadense TaxID=3634 RepID=A0A2P5VNU4_GOSBA|nr:hypothetical protein GOBAR_AA40210 [Gossypium barbadense]
MDRSRKRNGIVGIKREGVTDEEERKVTPKMNVDLLQPFLPEEVWVAVKSMSPLKTSGAYSSTFTIVNNCNYTVWPAVVSYPQSTQISPSGFILQPGESTSISVPPSWSGRISGRTHCGTDSSGNFSCLTGDCGTSRPECSGNSSIQATLAEFYFNSSVGSDFYDVSLVDGFNLPLMISPHGGTGDDCNSTGCVADLNGDCPSELKVVNGSETVASTPKMMQTVPSVVLLLIMTSLSAHPLPPGLMEVQRKEWRIKQVATSAMLPVEPAVPTATIEQSATVPLDFTTRQSSNNVSA